MADRRLTARPGALVAGLALACVTAAGGATAPAAPAAINADCVWSTLPQDIRAALVQAGPQADQLKSTLDGGEPAWLKAMAGKCGLTQAVGVDAAFDDIVTAKAAELWSGGQLRARYGVDDARLAAAWSRFPAASSQGLAAAYQKNADPTDAERADLAAMTKALGIEGAAGLGLVSVYAASRSIFESRGGTG